MLVHVGSYCPTTKCYWIPPENAFLLLAHLIAVRHQYRLDRASRQLARYRPLKLFTRLGEQLYVLADGMCDRFLIDADLGAVA